VGSSKVVTGVNGNYNYFLRRFLEEDLYARVMHPADYDDVDDEGGSSV
jgi:hypothetical protein